MRRYGSVYNPIPGGRRTLAVLILFLSAAGWRAEGSYLGDYNLADASLEELMNIEVRSVGRKTQKLTSVASAIYIITREDIRRSGAASVPEVLRMAPGLQVARIDASKWGISARGFNGRFSNKMLVLVDGRTIYNNMYSGVYWDQNDVPLENIEHIEVIRGPGATMWGANAVNGVINIITRQASDTQGVLVATGAGVEDRGSGLVQYGGAVSDRFHYRVFGKANNWNHLSGAGGAGSGGDDWRQRRGGARLDWRFSQRDLLTVHGDGYTGSGSQSAYANFPQTNGPIASEHVAFNGGYLLTRWDRSHSNGSETALQVYANQENRSEPVGDARFLTLDLDVQHHVHGPARHDIVFGGGLRRLKDSIRSGTRAFDPESRADHMVSGFLQDDISLLPERLILTVGTKLLHNSYSGLEVQPSARLLYAASPQEQFWSAVSRAVRTPCRRDHDLAMYFNLPQPTPFPGAVGLFAGNADFRSEKVIAYEAGYRNLLRGRVAVDVASFFNRYSSLESFGVGQPFLQTVPVRRMVLPIRVENNNRGYTYGVDVTSTWSLNSRWRVYANYSWLRVHVSSAAQERSSFEQGAPAPSPPAILFYEIAGSRRNPQHLAQVRSSIDVTPAWSVDAGVHRVSELAGVRIPGYTRADLHLNWRLRGGLQLSAGFSDVLNPSHREMLSEERISGSEMRRGPYVKLTWTFAAAKGEERPAQTTGLTRAGGR